MVFTTAPNLANYDALSNPDDLPFVSTSLTVRIVRVSTNSRPDSYDLDDHVQAELGEATFEHCRLESHDALFDFPEEITATGAMRRHTCQTGYEVIETMASSAPIRSGWCSHGGPAGRDGPSDRHPRLGAALGPATRLTSLPTGYSRSNAPMRAATTSISPSRRVDGSTFRNCAPS